MPARLDLSKDATGRVDIFNSSGLFSLHHHQGTCCNKKSITTRESIDIDCVYFGSSSSLIASLEIAYSIVKVGDCCC